MVSIEQYRAFYINNPPGPQQVTVTNSPLDGYITNFPETQEVIGTVSVIDPLTSTQHGTWNYMAGVNGTVNVLGRIRGIIAHSTAGGDFTINGGDTVTIPANVGIEINPQGLLVDPTIVFSSGIDSYFIEYVT
jgi:hypothetical protein